MSFETSADDDELLREASRFTSFTAQAQTGEIPGHIFKLDARTQEQRFGLDSEIESELEDERLALTKKQPQELQQQHQQQQQEQQQEQEEVERKESASAAPAQSSKPKQGQKKRGSTRANGKRARTARERVIEDAPVAPLSSSPAYISPSTSLAALGSDSYGADGTLAAGVVRAFQAEDLESGAASEHSRSSSRSPSFAAGRFRESSPSWERERAARQEAIERAKLDLARERERIRREREAVGLHLGSYQQGSRGATLPDTDEERQWLLDGTRPWSCWHGIVGAFCGSQMNWLTSWLGY